MRRIMVAIGLLLLAPSAEASRHAKRGKAATHKRAARAAPRAVVHTASESRAPGQSVGAPWDGALRDPAQLPDGDGYVIRRPWRSFGTSTTVDLVGRVVADWRLAFPDSHVLAIGDISAEHGGAITEHHSHQSGRDVDIGLVYQHKPPAYPDSFVTATADNLDCEATFALVEKFAATAGEDGGAQMIFLDFAVQGLLYRWALGHDVDRDYLDELFQFPHGRASGAGLVRHVPNHDNHIHVRFRCARGDRSCQ